MIADPKAAAAPTADVVVVGTGVVGLAVALELLQRGRRVAVVGPRTGAHRGQATRAAGAMLSTFSEIEPQHPARRTAIDTQQRLAAHRAYPAWLDRIAAAGGGRVEHAPGTWVVAPAGRGAYLAPIARAARAAGHPADLHDAADVPGIAVPATSAGALWLPTEARVDSTVLMHALTTAIAAHPACAWRDTTARQVTGGPDPAVACADGTLVRAGTVVVAAGAASGRLLQPWGPDAGVPAILAGRGVSVVLDVPADAGPPFTVRTPNAAFACGVHLVPRTTNGPTAGSPGGSSGAGGRGACYLGGTNRLTLDPDPGDGPAVNEVQVLLGDAHTLLDTGLGRARITTARVGYRPYTLDHLPLIGHTGDPTVLLATATYRCGVLLAPHLARLIGDELDQPGALDEHPYRATRPPPPPHMTQILRDGAPSLVEHLLQDGGHLHPAHADRLAAFTSTALRALLSDSAPDSGALRRLWRQAPVSENLPALYDLAARLATRTTQPTVQPVVDRELT